LLKNIYALTLASFCSLTKSYLRLSHRKTNTMTGCTHINVSEEY